MRINAKGATKGQALCAVADALNIPIETVVAFGDDINDIDMLRTAGASVAMSNAIENVAAVADYICGDCDEDGVARWLTENINGLRFKTVIRLKTKQEDEK